MLKFALVLFVEIFLSDGSIAIVRMESEFKTSAQCNRAAQNVAYRHGVISAECYRLTFA